MNKALSKLVALLLTGSVLLSGCAGTAGQQGETEQSGENSSAQSESAEEDNTITDLVIPKLSTKEIAGFNILYT